jgi:hypothetical protein
VFAGQVLCRWSSVSSSSITVAIGSGILVEPLFAFFAVFGFCFVLILW